LTYHRLRIALTLLYCYALIHSIGGQCDLNLYGVEVSDDHFSIKALDPKTGELSIAFDSLMSIGAISAGSHIVMNDVYYLVDQSNTIFAFDIKNGKLDFKQDFLSRSLRFMEASACDSLIYGMSYQSINGPAFLSVYDPIRNQLSQITNQNNLLDINLDQNSIHTKLGDAYILISNGQLYNINIHTGQIEKQYSVAQFNLISYVADPGTGLLYGIEIIPNGFTLKSINPSTGESKLIGSNIKNYQVIAKSAHAITDGHYYTILNRTYYKLDISTGTILDEYPIHLDIFKNVEFNNSCISIINSIASENTSCGQNNGSLIVTTNSPTESYTYHWQSDLDKFSTDETKIEDLASGEYKLTVTSHDGSCIDTTSIYVNESETLDFTIEAKNLGCEGEPDGQINIEIDGRADNYRYSIDNGKNFQSSNSFTELEAGLYNIVIQGNEDCSARDLITLEEPDEFDISIIDSMEVSFGEEVVLEPNIALTHGGVFLSWTSETSSDNLSCNECENPVVRPLQSTTYYLHVIDIFSGCTAIDSIALIVKENNRDVYIPNIFSPNSDGFNDEFTVFGNDVKLIEQIVIYDRWGSRIHFKENIKPDDPKSVWNGTFNGQPLASDTYTYIIHVVYQDGLRKIFSGQIFLAD